MKKKTTPRCAVSMALLFLLAANAAKAQTYFAGSGAGAGNTGTLVTGVGTFAVGSSNSGGTLAAFGSNALFKNTTGNGNSAIGANSMYNNTTGKANTGIGKSSLYRNTTGDSNTAAGFHALYNNTTGINNTATGSYSLYTNTTCRINTSFGSSALRNNITGTANTATGFSSLYSNTHGYSNTATGAYSLRSNTTGVRNSAVGDSAMLTNTTGSNNVTVGYNALKNNVTGSANTAIGVNTLENNKGTYSTAVGAYALQLNVSSSNSAFGAQSLRNNTTGSKNTAAGQNSLFSNTSGSGNAAFGETALQVNTTGKENTAIGLASLNFSNGNYNTAVGFATLLYSVSNEYNAAIGWKAGNGDLIGDEATIYRVGSQCTFLGARADVSVNDISNSTAIGYNTKVNASNKVVVGNTAVTSIGGQVGWTTYSDQRLKTNITKSKLGLDFILTLNPVTYNYKAEGQQNILYTGLIAQEVDEAAAKAGVAFSAVDKNGENWGIRYGELTVPLVKAVQEMEEKHKTEVEMLNSRIAKLEEAIARLLQNEPDNAAAGKRSFLLQNQPNPFNSNATIKYMLKPGDENAVLIIRDIKGSTLKQVNIKSAGPGSITVSGGAFTAGTYTYSLLVKGEVVDTKLMILAK